MKKYIDSFVNYRFLLSELVKKGIKLKYRRSYLGIIWSLLEPLCTMIVLTVVFGTILGNRTKEFSVYILCGRLLFSFYSTSTKAALTSIRKNATMIKKVYVPKRSKKEVRSLTKLFEAQKSVCVKCRIVTDSETMHCLVCNACVDNWDHHCFWLNTCINTENKKSFKFFFYTMFIFTMLNMLFFLESKFYHITL